MDDRRILYMVWKRKPFCNIQPHEQHSPGGRHVTVNIYNQDFTRANTEGSSQGANKARLDFAKKKKTSKKAKLLEKLSLDG